MNKNITCERDPNVSVLPMKKKKGKWKLVTCLPSVIGFQPG